MTDGKEKMPNINLLDSASQSTRSNSFGAWKKEQFKNILRNDFNQKIEKLKKDYGCGFTIDMIISKLGYKPYNFNELPNDDEDFSLIEYIDDMIEDIYEPNDVSDIYVVEKIPYSLEPDNNTEPHIGSKNNEIEENILALKDFILNVQQKQKDHHTDLDYGIVAREDLNALVIYLEFNYNLYEYIFTMEKKENENKFLDEIVNFCRENSIIFYH